MFTKPLFVKKMNDAGNVNKNVFEVIYDTAESFGTYLQV